VVHAVGGRYRLEYPPGKVLYETQTWIDQPRFSRDGRLIAFLDHLALGDDRGRVAVVDLEGKVRFLTEAFSSSSGLVWSPAGDEIWASLTPVGTILSVYGVDLSGRLRVVDSAPVSLIIEDVSRSGKTLVIRHLGRRGILGTRPGDPTERDLSWLDWS